MSYRAAGKQATLAISTGPRRSRATVIAGSRGQGNASVQLPVSDGRIVSRRQTD